jgi:hypothetical protein
VIGIVLGAIGLAGVASTPWVFRALARAMPDDGLMKTAAGLDAPRRRQASYGPGVRYTIAEPYDYEVARAAARRAQGRSASGAPLRLKSPSSRRHAADAPIPFRVRKRG